MADNIEVGDLVARISFDDTGLNKSMAEINRQMKLVESEFGKASTALKGYGSTEEQLKAKTDALNQQMQLQQQKINKLNESLQDSAATKGADAAETQRLATELNKAQTVYNKLETELDGVNKELEEQRKQAELAANPWKKLGNELENAGAKMTKVGDKMKSIGSSLSLKVTAPIVALSTLSAKAAIDFESAFAGVRKTVDATEEEFAVLESGIRKMSKEMPAAATEIAAVAESAGQLGIAKENILEFSEVMIGLGEATNLSAEEAATQLARFANITQMSQGDFDKLGSSLVALGNNMATTEGEIVAMSLRLAAQGKQIGMSEAQITALAATMSSLGIEAEAGGTAMTTILKKIQSAVGEGGKELDDFAVAARMSSHDFTKAFKSDPVKALDVFVKGLSQSSSEGQNLTSILSKLGISGIRESDTLLRMAGAADLLSAAVETSTDAWRENTALTNEVAQRYGTTESKLKMFKNQVTDLAIQIGDILLPIIMDIVKAIQPWVEKFAAMDKSSQKVILAIAGIAAAIGPVIVVIGSLISSIGTIVSLFGTLSAAIATAGGASAVLSAAFTAMTGPIGLVVAAVAALTVGGIALYKHLKKDAIPEIQRFGDEVSESTQQAVGAFFDLNDKATLALNELTWAGKTVTKEMSAELINTFDAMGDQIIAGMEADHAKQLETLEQFFANSSALTDEEEAAALEQVRKGQEERAQAINEGQARIAEIMNMASEERRALTRNETAEITRIQQAMVDTGIAVLSENELEQRAIMERMNANASTLSAIQAAEVVRNSVAQRDGAIAAAEEQYNDVIKEIIRQRDEVGAISAEQAARLIEDAQRQRDETVNLAQQMHDNILTAAKEKSGEHIDLIDWETGEVLKKWEEYRNKLQGWQDKIDKFFIDAWNGIVKSIKDKTTEIVNNVKEHFENIVTYLKELPEKMKNLGIDIIQGLINGISSMMNNIKDKVKEVAGSITNGIKKALDINSPSRVTMELGEWTGIGLAEGIEGSLDAVKKATATVAGAAMPDLSAVAASPAAVASSGNSTVINLKISGNSFNGPSDEDRLVSKISRMLAKDFGLSTGGVF